MTHGRKMLGVRQITLQILIASVQKGSEPASIAQLHLKATNLEDEALASNAECRYEAMFLVNRQKRRQKPNKNWEVVENRKTFAKTFSSVASGEHSLHHVDVIDLFANFQLPLFRRPEQNSFPNVLWLSLCSVAQNLAQQGIHAMALPCHTSLARQCPTSATMSTIRSYKRR